MSPLYYSHFTNSSHMSDWILCFALIVGGNFLCSLVCCTDDPKFVFKRLLGVNEMLVYVWGFPICSKH